MKMKKMILAVFTRAPSRRIPKNQSRLPVFMAEPDLMAAAVFGRAGSGRKRGANVCKHQEKR
ncbi:hypothetical protein [Bradyrhizobium sp. USDA 4486]